MGFELGVAASCAAETTDPGRIWQVASTSERLTRARGDGTWCTALCLLFPAILHVSYPAHYCVWVSVAIAICLHGTPGLSVCCQVADPFLNTQLGEGVATCSQHRMLCVSTSGPLGELLFFITCSHFLCYLLFFLTFQGLSVSPNLQEIMSVPATQLQMTLSWAGTVLQSLSLQTHLSMSSQSGAPERLDTCPCPPASCTGIA